MSDQHHSESLGEMIGTVIGVVLVGFIGILFYPGLLVASLAHRYPALKKPIWLVIKVVLVAVLVPIFLMIMFDVSEAHTVPTRVRLFSFAPWGWQAVTTKLFSPPLVNEYGLFYAVFAYIAWQLGVVAPIYLWRGPPASRRGFDLLRGQFKREGAPGTDIRLPAPGFFARLKLGKPVPIEAGCVTLGRSEQTGDVVRLNDERTMHLQIVGSSGSGKTEAIKRIVEADMVAGRPVIWIDGKGDRRNAAWFANVAAAAGRGDEARYFLPDIKHGSYNPFKYGTPTERKDRLMSAMVWSEEYYKDRCEEILQVVLNALCSVPNKSFTLEDVAEALDATGNALPHLMAHSKDDRAKRHLARFAKDKEWQAAVSGLRAKLNAFVISDYGDMLTSQKNQVDLWRAYAKRRPVYVSLPIGLAPQLMPRFGKMLLAELNSINSALATGRLASNGIGCSVIIDEFSNFVCELFIAFLQSARSQGFMITIAHQSLGDLERFDPAMRKQILTNTNTKLILKQDAPEDAEIWAKLIGTRSAFEKTRQIEQALFGDTETGLGSMKEIEEFIAHPNIIKNLPRGCGVFVCKQPRLITPIHCERPAILAEDDTVLKAHLAVRRFDQTIDWDLAHAKKEPLIEKPRPATPEKSEDDAANAAHAGIVKIPGGIQLVAKHKNQMDNVPRVICDLPVVEQPQDPPSGLTHGGEW